MIENMYIRVIILNEPLEDNVTEVIKTTVAGNAAERHAYNDTYNDT